MGLFGGGGGFDADKLVKTDVRGLAMGFMPGINSMGRQLQRDELNKALALSRGTMSPTDLPEFMRARQLQESGSRRALADVADRMTQLGVSGPAAAAVLDRQRQAGSSSNLQLAQSFGDITSAKVGQGIEMGNKAISFGLQSAGIQASADANYNTAQMAAEASGGGGGMGEALMGMGMDVAGMVGGSLLGPLGGMSSSMLKKLLGFGGGGMSFLGGGMGSGSSYGASAAGIGGGIR